MGGHWRRLAHGEDVASDYESYFVEHRRFGCWSASILGRRRLLLVADKGLPSSASSIHALELDLDRGSLSSNLMASGRVVWLRIVPVRNC
jgi:hypothetical protein